jgi:hypothetical protein
VEERSDKSGQITSDYLIDVVPSLGISRRGAPMTAVGTNEFVHAPVDHFEYLHHYSGDIVLLHNSSNDVYDPSAYFLSHRTPDRGHKDVVRTLYHDLLNEAIYTGSEDGVLAGWSLSFSGGMLRVGDPDVDDDGGDGRENVDSDDEDDEQESEIESDDESDGMDVDSGDDREEGPRSGPILGGGRNAGRRKEKRKEKRVQPY